MDAGGRMRKTVDPEFAMYVDARQDRWLRAAYLVYGDLERAEAEAAVGPPLSAGRCHLDVT
ncbi:MAG TPA: hypothetical protein VGD71_42525 [Kribbella sp.]|jgi:hypothetical protein